MSKVLCMSCGAEAEPFGDFGPGGTTWRCGNVGKCKDPDNDGTTAIVYPEGVGTLIAASATVTPAQPRALRLVGASTQPINASAAIEPPRLEDMLVGIRARRDFLAAEIAKRIDYERELARLDLILTHMRAPDTAETA